MKSLKQALNFLAQMGAMWVVAFVLVLLVQLAR